MAYLHNNNNFILLLNSLCVTIFTVTIPGEHHNTQPRKGRELSYQPGKPVSTHYKDIHNASMLSRTWYLASLAPRNEGTENVVLRPRHHPWYHDEPRCDYLDLRTSITFTLHGEYLPSPSGPRNIIFSKHEEYQRPTSPVAAAGSPRNVFCPRSVVWKMGLQVQLLALPGRLLNCSLIPVVSSFYSQVKLPPMNTVI